MHKQTYYTFEAELDENGNGVVGYDQKRRYRYALVRSCCAQSETTVSGAEHLRLGLASGFAGDCSAASCAASA